MYTKNKLFILKLVLFATHLRICIYYYNKCLWIYELKSDIDKIQKILICGIGILTIRKYEQNVYKINVFSNFNIFDRTCLLYIGIHL